MLSLVLSGDGKLLFSAGDEGFVRVWSVFPDAGVFPCIRLIYAGEHCGDINALAFSSALNMLYLGCKNASLQFFDMSRGRRLSKAEQLEHIRSRDSRFFKLEGLLEEEPPVVSIDNENLDSFQGHRDRVDSVCVSVISDDMIIPMSHNGFLYCLLLSQFDGKHQLYTGAGDGKVKIWNIESRFPSLVETLHVSDGSVFDLTVSDEFLYTGSQDGEIKVWDLGTYQCMRTIIGHDCDILALTSWSGYVFSGSADGAIKCWKNFECVETHREHHKIVLSLVVSNGFLISGSNDNQVKIWEIEKDLVVSDARPDHDVMLESLRQLIEYASVSGNQIYSSQSLRCAKYLKSLFVEHGAESMFISTAPLKNPIVASRFSANDCHSFKQQCLNILIYGHYDVQPADPPEWKYHPFEMTGCDGYIYGRGASDNKGPIIAMLFAVSELYEKRKLPCNVYFAIEGEEESGSAGFFDAIRQTRAFFGDVDLILFSNSYWLTENRPCLTYGLRGVIHSRIEIKSPHNQDLHSGVHGGAFDEPSSDMIQLLSRLKQDRRILIPGFYSDIREVNKEEVHEFEELLNDAAYPSTVDTLIARWTLPTLTVHKITASSPASNTVISRKVEANVSMRIVPDQDIEVICKTFEQYLADEFSKMNTKNHLSIEIGQQANWWLEDRKHTAFEIAAKAVEAEWGVPPLMIREGGSIPAIPFLKSIFEAVVLQIPMGQSSDNAHLPNERIGIVNLRRGKDVIKSFLSALKFDANQ